MTVIDDLAHHAEEYARAFHDPDLPTEPGLKLAVVTCMDSRIDLFRLLGVGIGDAHVLRNAGGVITPLEIRALAISQRVLGTRAVMIIHHTRCGAGALDEEEFRREIGEELGQPADWAAHPSRDLRVDLADAVARVRESPFLLHRDEVRGFLYDVDTGALTEQS